MKKTTFSLLFFIGFQFFIFSQDKSIEVGTGLWGNSKLFEGYYLSSNIQISLSNTFSISPTFTYGETFPSKYNSLMISEYDELIGYEQGKLKSFYNDVHFSSLDLILFVNLMKLINRNESKNKLLIGTGFGFKSYASSRVNYNITNQIPTLKSLSFKRESGFEPYYLKILYKYKIKENVYLGSNISVNSLDGEGVFLYGLNMGVYF